MLLTKGIDNQILTSFRTLTKANNVVSDTLKIVHTKFSPTPMSNGAATKMRKAYGHQLYVINEEAINRVSEEIEEDAPQQADTAGQEENQLRGP